ncbi:methylenetetrahydrofolate--tRNA-(uracil(54)-C(5))-methyltransferase (FADH(2)-oxidizing) TrmFO [Mycoplasmatota bacterium]|nr:methylenetetrahydrofolate--tRNA-(uracil(54)-C(5))-methyltransferase (FADH(2)-oxidizing) TrmFO [Mycoplasmatota bacterium]
MGSYVNVIGAGLAGSEAAWQLAEKGIQVRLYEMRPKINTPAHHTDFFAELVCSNSLRSNSLENAVGILKEEMRYLNSLVLRAADKFRVPAGGALAVDRIEFSKWITSEILSHKNIEVIYDAVTDIPNGPTIIATGPLTSNALSESIKEFLGIEYLSFFDAAAPIVTKDSIDMTKAYLKSRYDKGAADYINCPMNILEFNKFHRELINAETQILKDFEVNVFEGCMPFEVMAKRGKKTLLFGPMKPVGLEHDNVKPYAVVQLRQDNAIGDLYNVVGFQTNLKFGEQKRILRMIPGLESVEIIRYGVMHRNTFINSPKVLKNTYQCQFRDDLFFAGQITGVEGYVESVASGLLAGLNIAKFILNEEMYSLSSKSIIGSMVNYISNENIQNFQPMNANFGLMPSLEEKHHKKDRKRLYGERALESIVTEFGLNR